MNAIRQLEALSDDTAANLAIARLESVISQAGISDNQTVGEYMVSQVEKVVDARISLPEETKMELMKRIFKEEGGNIRKVLKLIPQEDAASIAAVRQLVGEAGALLKQAIAPVEEIVHDFSVEMLRGLQSAFVLDNEAEVGRLRAETSRAIQAIEGSDSEEAMEILTKQMSKLKDVEGVSTAAEGFVFDYDGVTYKFTGNFAPMNQLLGLFKYGRGNVPPLQKLDEEEVNIETQRTIAVVPGAFKPPHRGHLEMVQHYANMADKVVIMVSPLPRKTPDGTDIGFGVSKAIWDIYLRDTGLLDRVEVIRSPVNSPVGATYQFVENVDDLPNLAQPGDLIIPGWSTKGGDQARFQANFEKYAREGVQIADPIDCAFVAEGEALSASDFRAALAAGAGLEEFIPEETSPQEILAVLGVEEGPDLPLGEMLLNLVRETIEEASSMGAGDVGGFSGGNKNKRSLIRVAEAGAHTDHEDRAVGRDHEAITPEAINLFHEWIVNERKDEAVLEWIRTTKNMKRHDGVDAYGKPRSAYHAWSGDAEKEYDKAKRRLNRIKTEFKYDVFPDLDHSDNECHQRLRLLDKLVVRFLRYPYPVDPDSTEQNENIKKATVPDEETPYQTCARNLRARKHARKEVGRVTDPYENPKEEEEEEVIEEVLNYLLGKGVVL
jgi:hypothetical protein